MKKKVRFSLYAKATILISVAALILVEVAMFYFSMVTSSTNQNRYKDIGNNLSATVSAVIDAEQFKELKGEVSAIVDATETIPSIDDRESEEWNTYIAQFEPIQSKPCFLEMREKLRKIADANKQDADCVYLAYIDAARELFVYCVDSAPDEDACPPGWIDPIFDVNREILTNPERGFPAYITDTEEYGALVTAGVPVRYNGEIVGYSFVDIPLATVKATQAGQIIRLFIYLLVTTLVLAAIVIYIVHLTFVRPLRKLNAAASSYDATNPEGTHEIFKNLDVHTRDEMAVLSASMVQMEQDVYNKIEELTRMNEELRASQQETERMTELANKDGLTGVRNKASYEQEVALIEQEIEAGKMEPFALAMIDLNDLKVINDEHGHRHGDTAIITLANVTCGVFVHSPVFRVGGDEFVAILRGNDFRYRKELVAEFRKKIDQLSRDEELSFAERISAAIGYADFEEGKDQKVIDVFTRADEAMYEAKRSMKRRAN